MDYSGCSQTVASGGKVSDSECSKPWIGCGSAEIDPPLPVFDPP
jgi:hypothetical protein